jgi:hypothetical protein
MSVNFYDNSGVMVGVDFHVFYQLAPPVMAGVPVPSAHAVAAPFLWPPATFGKRTGKVKSDGWKMIQAEFTLFLVPHVPAHLPSDWGGLESGQLTVVIATSNSKAKMKVHGVTGQGAPLATCLAGPVGLNFNCKGAGGVLDINSVKTKPTWGDYLTLALGMALDAALDKAWEKGLEKILEKIAEKRHFVIKVTIAILKKAAPTVSKILKSHGLPDVPGWITGIADTITERIAKVVDGEE